MADIFVSYTSADSEWAKWIAQQLEALGHVPHVHEWEISGGGDIMAWMEERHDKADHVLCVVSSAYLTASHSALERRAAQWAAASKRSNFLLPVYVEACEPPTLLAPLKHCELYGVLEDEARARLKEFLTPAAKPTDPVAFPGGGKPAAPNSQPAIEFPGKPYPSNIPIAVPRHFVGRDDVLADIKTQLARDQGRVAITALHGLRGVGKTTLAAAYAVRHRADYRATWWIRAETESTMRADIVGLGVRLGWIAADEKEQPALTAVSERLRNEGDGILLIFDNAIGAASIKVCLPSSGAAKILITSNSDVWREVATPVEIEVWPREVGADYVVARTGRAKERESAMALSDALEGLPLAHEQAAAYCERLKVSLLEYRNRFQQSPARFLDDARDAPDAYHDGTTVAKTFALAIDEAAKLHPAAESLIVHAALLAPEPIPLFLFSEARSQFGEPLASALAGDGLDEAVAALRAFALIDRESIVDERNPGITTDCIRLHRLVRHVAAARCEGVTREEVRSALLRALVAVYPSKVFNEPHLRPRARRLDAIALDVASGDLARRSEAAALLLYRLASYRHESPADVSGGSAAIRSDQFERDRIFRLRADIDAFRRDLKLIDDGVKIVLIPDSAEIRSYISPDDLLGYYCFPIEDRASYDEEYARLHGKLPLFSEHNRINKVRRRALRARRHLFHPTYPNILIPPYLSELEVSLSIIMAQDIKDLDSLSVVMVDYIRDHLLHENSVLAGDVRNFGNLAAARRIEVLKNVFDKVVENPTLYLGGLKPEKRHHRISNISRAKDFLDNTASYGLEDYDWRSVAPEVDERLLDKLRNIKPSTELTTHIENLFYRLPKGGQSSLALYTDARALAYVASINECLQSEGLNNVRVQLVSWGLAPATVARALWPETGSMSVSIPPVEVRHPKLLAAAISFEEGEEGAVRRSDVELHLDRLSGAMRLYETTEVGDVAARERKWRDIGDAWARLDDTLLAWTAPIQSTNPSRLSDSAEEGILESFRTVVEDHRGEFEQYLTARIDRLSKELSDSHWNVVRPANVGDIRAVKLFYQAGDYVVIRPMPDHPGCTVALYSSAIVDVVAESFVKGINFGQVLIELTKGHSRKGAADDISLRAFRAEIQLLKALFFVIREDYVAGANYCRLARSELGSSDKMTQSSAPKDAARALRIHAEALYLAHYAHRRIGISSGAPQELERGLALLRDSETRLTSADGDSRHVLRPRYDISWTETSIEIAAAGNEERRLKQHERDRSVSAYQGCLAQLNGEHWSGALGEATLSMYHVARAAQNVMLGFVVNRFDIGNWRISFGDAVQPQEHDARKAWSIIQRLRELSKSRSPEEFTIYSGRVECLYWIGQYCFGDEISDRSSAINELRFYESFEYPAVSQAVRYICRMRGIHN